MSLIRSIFAKVFMDFEFFRNHPSRLVASCTNLFFCFWLKAIDELEVLDKLDSLDNLEALDSLDNLDSLENLSIYLSLASLFLLAAHNKLSKPSV